MIVRRWMWQRWGSSSSIVHQNSVLFQCIFSSFMRTSSLILVTKQAACLHRVSLILALDQSSCAVSKSGKDIEVVGSPFLWTADTCTLIFSTVVCPIPSQLRAFCGWGSRSWLDVAHSLMSGRAMIWGVIFTVLPWFVVSPLGGTLWVISYNNVHLVLIIAWTICAFVFEYGKHAQSIVNTILFHSLFTIR